MGKIKDREVLENNLSTQTYLRLTYLGLSILKIDDFEKENDCLSMEPNKKNQDDVSSYSIEGDNHPIAVSSTHQKVTAKSRTLFVGGLAWCTTEDSCRSSFCQYGPVEKVVVMSGRGFGFIRFRDIDSVKKVLDDINYQKIKIDNV